jgi:hypothetical protein
MKCASPGLSSAPTDFRATDIDDFARTYPFDYAA